MKEKLRILFYNLDGAGVNYFRTLTPAMELERNFSEDFYVEINPKIDFTDPEVVNYLKTFHIIHYHRQLINDTRQMVSLAKELRESGTILIVDIDDYWYLHKDHPFYSLGKERKMHIPIIENLKIADYVTTTSDLFADKIREITGKDNVTVLKNSVNPTWMKQFKDNHKPDPDGLVRITYAGGSSHYGDLVQLEGVVNVLNANPDVKGKFKIIIAGWDTEGTTTEVNFNQEFNTELRNRGLWNNKMVSAINTTRGNVDLLPKLPDDLKNKYRGKVFNETKRDIKSEESVYYKYEKFLTDNHRIIDNEDYYDWLMNFERNVKYDNEGNFARRWTEKANTYANVLNETDIVIAPLADNEFNYMKSNLKQVECWSRKLPVVCSDIPPYNVDGRNMENCILIPAKKNAHKYWIRALKKLILDADLRKRLGEQLYEDFKEEYHLTNVTKIRVDLYKDVIKKSLEIK